MFNPKKKSQACQSRIFNPKHFPARIFNPWISMEYTEKNFRNKFVPFQKLYTTSPPYDRIKSAIGWCDRTSPQFTTIRMHKPTIRSFKAVIYTIVWADKPVIRPYECTSPQYTTVQMHNAHCTIVQDHIIRPYECMHKLAVQSHNPTIFRRFFISQDIFRHYIPKILYIPSISYIPRMFEFYWSHLRSAIESS